MAIPNKQIGWSNEANLLWYIAKELEQIKGQLNRLPASPTTTTTSTTTAAPVYQYSITSTSSIDPSTACSSGTPMDLSAYALTDVGTSVTQFYSDQSLTTPFVGDGGAYKFIQAQSFTLHAGYVSGTGAVTGAQTCGK